MVHRLVTAGPVDSRGYRTIAARCAHPGCDTALTVKASPERADLALSRAREHHDDLALFDVPPTMSGDPL